MSNAACILRAPPGGCPRTCPEHGPELAKRPLVCRSGGTADGGSGPLTAPAQHSCSCGSGNPSLRAGVTRDCYFWHAGSCSQVNSCIDGSCARPYRLESLGALLTTVWVSPPGGLFDNRMNSDRLSPNSRLAMCIGLSRAIPRSLSLPSRANAVPITVSSPGGSVIRVLAGSAVVTRVSAFLCPSPGS